MLNDKAYLVNIIIYESAKSEVTTKNIAPKVNKCPPHYQLFFYQQTLNLQCQDENYIHRGGKTRCFEKSNKIVQTVHLRG